MTLPALGSVAAIGPAGFATLVWGSVLLVAAGFLYVVRGLLA